MYDMYLRKFLGREPELLPLKAKLFEEAELTEVEQCLERSKVRIAAALSR